MNKLRSVKIAQIALTMVLTATAFAASKGTMHLNQSEEVAGQKLVPGDYTVLWNGTGSDVELKFMQGKRVAATTLAHAVPLQAASPNDAVVLRTSKGGDQSLAAIFFEGKRVKMEIPSSASETIGAAGSN